MKEPFIGVLLLLAGAWSLGAQELNSVKASVADGSNVAASVQLDGTNVAASFASTSAARVNLLSDLNDASDTRSFADSAVAPTRAYAEPGAPFPAAPVPEPKPRFVFGDRDDYRWQLGIGVAFLRFQSKLFNANMVGTNTGVTFFTNDWFGLEGNVVTGFASPIYSNEHVKYVGYAGGVHLGSRRARWEPWAHALFGGGHLLPQTAGNSKNALAITAGGGVDYRLYARLSLRGEADYVYTRFFSQSQNDFQASAGIVIHF
jgi:opacity protein-like surface antigen